MDAIYDLRTSEHDQRRAGEQEGVILLVLQCHAIPSVSPAFLARPSPDVHRAVVLDVDLVEG